MLTFDTKRLVVLVQARKKILKILHYSHQGITKTYAAAQIKVLLAKHEKILPTNDTILLGV